MSELVLKFWGVIVGGIGLVVWMVRLEAGMKSNQAAILRLEEQRKEDNARADRQRDQIEAALIDIQRDVKNILVSLASKQDRK